MKNARLPRFGVITRKMGATSLISAFATCQLIAAVAMAQDNNLALEEVIVQAQRRAESLQDVPVAVSAVDGEQLIEQGLGDLQEMSTYVPSLNIIQSPGAIQIYIRGLGSSENVAFEQSVGLFVDGIYAGKSPQFSAPFLDVANVEVLRGPQGTLFGKNTIAGAITVNTVRPSQEFEAILRTNYDVEYQDYTLDAIVSAPLTDSLAGRIAIREVDMNGYLDNTFLDRDEFGSRQSMFRGSLLWDITETASLFLKYEKADTRTDGKSLITSQAGAWEPILRAADPGFSLADDTRSVDVIESLDIDSENFTMIFDASLGEFELTSITGYSQYFYDNYADPDTTALDVAVFNPVIDFDQWSQEVRLSSPVGGAIDYIVGAFYLKNELDTSRFSAIRTANAAGGPGVPDLFGIIPPLGLSADFNQDTESFALFGSLTWHLSERLRVNAGLRYTLEEKSADRNLFYTDDLGIPLDEAYNPVTDPGNNFLVRATLPVLGVFEHDIADDRQIEDWSPTVRVSYDVTDDMMLYFSASRAFKSGGFNEAGNRGDEPGEFPAGGDPANFEFDDEEALSFEVGGKMSFFGQRANLNFALFQTDFSDLQVSSFQGDSFIVGNAADVSTLGLELDGIARLTETVTFWGSATFLDAEYDTYTNAPCTVAQTTVFEANGGATGGCQQDISGRELSYAPELNAVLGLRYEKPFGDLFFAATVDLNYVSEQFTAVDLDPISIQDANTRINSRLSLSDLDKRWEVAVVGRNLTDETVATFATDGFLLTGVAFRHVAPPRTVELQLNLHW